MIAVDESSVNYISNGEDIDQSVFNRPIQQIVDQLNINFADLPDINSTDPVLTRSESDARYLNEANNLSDVDNPATARSNLGVGSMAERDVFISTAEPTVGDGANGDVWLLYEV